MDVNLTELVNETSRMLRPMTGENIDLQCETPESLCIVHVDPVQVQQVMVNLIVNARDAMPHGGRLVIGTSSVGILESSGVARAGVLPGPYVRLTVSDTGTGISEDVRSHLFEPFFTTKDIGKGTGLGLATCYGAVKQSGGYIWAESESGRGTTFVIHLPRVIGNRDVKTIHLHRDRLLTGTGRVLLVEDETALRELAAEALRSYGCKVMEAVDGATALR